MPKSDLAPTTDSSLESHRPPGSASALAAARRYAEAGWMVFPVHSVDPQGGCSCRRGSCSSTGKHPRTPSGLKDGTTDLKTIEAWWSHWPEANIGVVTGASSVLVVLDVDVDKGGEESLNALEARYERLPTTTLAITGSGGMHYLFRHPGHEVRNSAGKLGAGLDIRGDGGYIVAPPSNHASGGRYEWLFSPDEQELAEVPPWLLELLQTEQRQAGSPTSDRTLDAEGIHQGGRNEQLASIAGRLRAQGLEEAELRFALLEVNRERCRPPLPEAEVEAIARSIASYPIGPKRHKLTDYGNAERLIDPTRG